MKRPTITDVAQAAGVSKGTASAALNGRPTVADGTRMKVIEVAKSLGFQANRAARSLAGAPSQIVGMALNREARTLGLEPFFMELISGLEEELAGHGYGLLVQMVRDELDEIALYRNWSNERRVDGILLCDVRLDDHRVPELEQLGTPCVVLGPPSAAGSLINLWSDDAVSAQKTVRYLAALGHTNIAHVAGPPELAHTKIRTDAFQATCAQLGLQDAMTMVADYSGEAGARCTRELLSGTNHPTAIVYDNDVMAVAGLTAAAELGLAVPADVSVVAWDDSQICRLVHPPLTALTRDVPGYGRRAARLLLSSITGQPPADIHEAPADLNPRGTTARPQQQA